MPAPLAAIAGGLLKGAIGAAKVGAKVAVKGAKAGAKVGAKVGSKVGSKVKSGVKKINPNKVFNRKGKDKKTDKKIGGALDIIKKNDDKRKGFLVKYDKVFAKQQERQRRKNAESNLEATNKKKRNRFSRLKKTGGSILQKIIDFLTTILIGWVVDKLPKILKFAEDVTGKIKQIYQSIVDFGKTVGDFFTKIKDTIGGVVEKIKEFDFAKIGEKIKEKITGLKDGFTNIIDKIKGGLGLLKKKEGQDPKKLAKEGKTEESKKEDADIDKLSSETDNLLTEGEKEFKKFDETNKDNVTKSNVNINVETTKVDKDKGKIKVDKLMTPSASSATKEFSKDESSSGSTGMNEESKKLNKEKNVPVLSGTSGGGSKESKVTDLSGQFGMSGSNITFGGKGGSTYGGDKTMLNSSNTNKIDNSQVIGNLNTPKKKKTVVVNNPINIPNQQVASSSGEPQLMIFKQKKSDVLKEQQLINASYT